MGVNDSKQINRTHRHKQGVLAAGADADTFKGAQYNSHRQHSQMLGGPICQAQVGT